MAFPNLPAVCFSALALLIAGCAGDYRFGARAKATEPALAAGQAILEIHPRPSLPNFYVAVIDGPGGRKELSLAPIDGFFYRLEPGFNIITVKTLVSDYRSLPPDAEAPGATLHLLAQPGVAYTLGVVDNGKTLAFSIIERNTLRTVADGSSLPLFRAVPVDSIRRWDPDYVPTHDPLATPATVQEK